MITSKNYSTILKEKRQRMGLTQKNFAIILGLKNNGERTIRGWENGEHKPTKAKWNDILKLHESAPYKFDMTQKSQFKFIDLFAGIGGIRLPFQMRGGECVFTSEWDKFAQKTYAANYGEVPHGDITTISTEIIPDHDILLAGFPCQAFSQAGLKKGFSDSRGTLFFEIQRILTVKRPKAFLLENVKQLKNHDKGKTFEVITSILEGRDNNLDLSEEILTKLGNKLNYWISYRILKATDYGLPQNRQRIYIIGFNKDYYKNINFDSLFSWPEINNKKTKVGDILEEDNMIDDKYTISEKLWEGHKRRKQKHKEKGNGFGYSLFNTQSEYTNTISARYYKDGSEILIDQQHLNKRPRKLTPRECANLQGFPKNFIINAVSDAQIYKQFGNSVAMSVISKIADELVLTMNKADHFLSKKIQ